MPGAGLNCQPCDIPTLYCGKYGGDAAMYQINVLIQILCAVLAASILVYLLANGRRSRTTHSYMVCIGLLFFWNLSEVFIIISQTPEQEMLALKIKFLPVVYICVAWFYFCLNIAQSKLADNKYLKCFALIYPAICYGFLLTNEWHNLFYKAVIFKAKLLRGPVFWLHTAESYFFIFAGTIYFFMYMRKKTGKGLKNAILLLFAVLIPLTANILVLTEIIPEKVTDITSQVLLLSFVLLGIAVYQKRFLNLFPVAARHFIENMTDGIIIIDRENLVVGVNEAVNTLLPNIELKIYDQAQKIAEYIKINCKSDIVNALTSCLENSGCMKAEKGRIKIYDRTINIEIRPLVWFSKASTGKMVILENCTEEQQLLDEIRNKNILLTKANKGLIQSNTMLTNANRRLEDLSETIEELAIMRERNRVGREVHDTVGHMLTLLIALAENAKLKLPDDQQEIKDIMNKSIELSRQALNDIRNCLNDICREPFEKVSLVELMNHLVKTNASSGTRVEVCISEDLHGLSAEMIMAIYRICQESITNAIRHGEAKTVNIIIKNQMHLIRLYIFDDGKGCSDIVKGYGLTGMEERVLKLGGKITFGSDGENGFNVIAELPVC